MKKKFLVINLILALFIEVTYMLFTSCDGNLMFGQIPNKFDCFIEIIKLFVAKFDFQLVVVLFLFYIASLLVSLIITTLLLKIYKSRVGWVEPTVKPNDKR